MKLKLGLRDLPEITGQGEGRIHLQTQGCLTSKPVSFTSPPPPPCRLLNETRPEWQINGGSPMTLIFQIIG